MADAEKSKRAEKRARQKANAAAVAAETGGGYPAADAKPPVAKAKAAAPPASQPAPPAAAAKAKAKAEPKAAAQPEAKAKAKAKGKAEPEPKASAAPKAKAAAAPAPPTPAKAQQPAAKAKGKAKAAPAPEPPKEESKSIQEMMPVTIDDGTGGDWEVSASVSKKDKRRQERKEEQRALEETQKAASQKVIPGMAAAPLPQNSIPGMPQTKAEKKAAAAATAAAAAAQAAPLAPAQAQEEAKEAPKPGSIVTVMVPENKIGRIIGPKGATLKMLQEKTGVSRIDTTGEMFTITGEPNAVAMAETAMREMIEKGYMSLAFDNFEEASVQVHPSAFPDLIGKQGAVIRKIKEELKAEIEIPPVPKNGHPAKKYKVTIAGSKDAVAKAKEVINDLMMYYHSELTHPGEVHEEIVVQEWQLAYVIGKGGSEMRHIQKNFNVRMYVPREHSMNQQTVIVGERVNVDRAKTYVEKMLWNAEHAPRGRDKAQGAGDYDDNKDDEEQEPWMDQYMFKRRR